MVAPELGDGFATAAPGLGLDGGRERLAGEDDDDGDSTAAAVGWWGASGGLGARGELELISDIGHDGRARRHHESLATWEWRVRGEGREWRVLRARGLGVLPYRQGTRRWIATLRGLLQK